MKYVLVEFDNQLQHNQPVYSKSRDHQVQSERRQKPEQLSWERMVSSTPGFQIKSNNFDIILKKSSRTCQYLFNISVITFYCHLHFAGLVKMPILQK